MNQEPQTRLINFGRPPKGERRVRFADTMGMELVSIFLFELINEYFHNQHNRTRKNQIKATSHNSHHGYHSSNYSSDNSLYNKNTTYTINNNNNSSHYNATSYDHSNRTNTYSTATRSTSSSSSSSSSSTSSSPSASSQAPFSPSSSSSPPSTTPVFTCEFTQPISLLSFNERVKLNKVHLETCQINSSAGHLSVSCTIRVLNLSYDKSVIVRYTTDDWRTHADSLASYKPGSSDGWSDRFSSTFTLTDLAKSFKPGQRIIFAIRCSFDGNNTHWDNNGGLNYAIRSSLSGR